MPCRQELLEKTESSTTPTKSSPFKAESTSTPKSSRSPLRDRDVFMTQNSNTRRRLTGISEQIEHVDQNKEKEEGHGEKQKSIAPLSLSLSRSLARSLSLSLSLSGPSVGLCTRRHPHHASSTEKEKKSPAALCEVGGGMRKLAQTPRQRMQPPARLVQREWSRQ